MTAEETKLLSILKARSFQKGKFILASGVMSDYYLDLREATMNPDVASLIGRILGHRLWIKPFDAVGGMATGAIPLVMAAVLQFDQWERTAEGFFVRETEKDHGDRKLIAGRIVSGDWVAIVEDVITTGASTVKAIRAVQDIGCKVIAVIAMVDRLQGGEEAVRAAGVSDYQAVFTINDFLDQLPVGERNDA